METKKVKETVAPEEQAVKTESERMNEFLSNDKNREDATNQAIKLYSILTGQSTIEGHEDRVFTETEACKRTTLSHNQAKRLFQLWAMFGILEPLQGQSFKFHFLKVQQHELILRGIKAVAEVIRVDIARFYASLDSDKGLTDEQRKAYEKELKEAIKNALK